MKDYKQEIERLKAAGNYRSLPVGMASVGAYDFTSNDYLGIATDKELASAFFESLDFSKVAMGSSASRLLLQKQDDYYSLESYLSELYGKPAIIYNSGYHANTGIVSALADNDTLIIADKFVHASIIDGIILSRSKFKRFRHNDMAHLRKLLEDASGEKRVLVIVESIYSMDGDECDLKELVRLKQEFSNVLLYVDEAHAFGVVGTQGLGLAERDNVIADIDILVGTFGKSCASVGAFVIVDTIVKEYLINKSRSLIFSTAIPPLNCRWTEFVIRKMVSMYSRREHLRKISSMLRDFVNPLNADVKSTSQIVPLVLGDSKLVLELSQKLRENNIIALPIRKPTVPQGTERIRFSLSSALDEQLIEYLIATLKSML